jgi:hypothetical protein
MTTEFDSSHSPSGEAAAESGVDPDAPPGWPPWFERFVLPYVQESSLLVIWLIVLIHIVMALSVVLIFAIRDRHQAGMLALLLLVLATFEVARVEYSWHRKLGGMSVTAAGCWIVSFGLAFVASESGVF